MDLLGPFEQEAPGEKDPGGAITLTFYPGPETEVSADAVLAALPRPMRDLAPTVVSVETIHVSRDWVEGWRDHFRPVVIEAIRVRPPWEPASDLVHGLLDVVINPGLGFGTGLHPTTRGVLKLLQRGMADRKEGMPFGGEPARHPLGRLVDVGTGSGILAIAAAKLGWGPILAFDNDAQALMSARANMVANRVGDRVEVHEIGVSEAPLGWFREATVLANLTLEPVLALLSKLGPGLGPSGHGPGGGDLPGPVCLVVSGILAGNQERKLRRAAGESGFLLGERVREDEWVSLELVPALAVGERTDSGRGDGAVAGDKRAAGRGG
jgi:ribosomal protein L11 methyltransferase